MTKLTKYIKRLFSIYIHNWFLHKLRDPNPLGIEFHKKEPFGDRRSQLVHACITCISLARALASFYSQTLAWVILEVLHSSGNQEFIWMCVRCLYMFVLYLVDFICDYYVASFLVFAGLMLVEIDHLNTMIHVNYV